GGGTAGGRGEVGEAGGAQRVVHRRGDARGIGGRDGARGQGLFVDPGVDGIAPPPGAPPREGLLRGHRPRRRKGQRQIVFGALAVEARHGDRVWRGRGGVGGREVGGQRDVLRRLRRAAEPVDVDRRERGERRRGELRDVAVGDRGRLRRGQL